MPTPKERFLQLCREFPKHITMTLAACIIPCAAGCVSVVISGMYFRNLAIERSSFVGDLNHLETENNQVCTQSNLCLSDEPMP
jgi:hypothetical protein